MAGPGPRYWLAVSRLAEVSVQMVDVTAHGYVGRSKGVDIFYRVFAFAATSPLLDGGLVLFWMTKIIAITSSAGMIQMQIGEDGVSLQLFRSPGKCRGCAQASVCEICEVQDSVYLTAYSGPELVLRLHSVEEIEMVAIFDTRLHAEDSAQYQAL